MDAVVSQGVVDCQFFLLLLLGLSPPVSFWPFAYLTEFHDIGILESPPLKLHGEGSAPYDKDISNSETDLLGEVYIPDSRDPSSALTRFCRKVDWAQVRANARAYLNLLLVMAVAYLTIFCIFGEISLPALYLMLIWQAAHIGGFVFDLFRLPSILGMMLVGFILRNFMGPILDPLPCVPGVCSRVF